MSDVEEKLIINDITEAEKLSVIEQLEREANTQTPMTLMYLYTPKFDRLVDNLSSNALRRVVKKLASYPFNASEFKATSESEQTAFAIGERLIEAKFVIKMDKMLEMMEKNKGQAEELTKAMEQGEKENV